MHRASLLSTQSLHDNPAPAAPLACTAWLRTSPDQRRNPRIVVLMKALQASFAAET